MDKKNVIAVFAVAVCVLCVSAAVWYYRSSIVSLIMPAPKPVHIAVIADMDTYYDNAVGFKQKMTELGYIEGTNVVYDESRTVNNLAASEAATQKFVDQKVDLFFAFPSSGAIAVAEKQTLLGADIPLIFSHTTMDDPAIADRLHRSTVMLTGVSRPVGMATERFKLLHSIAPRARHLLVPLMFSNPTMRGLLASLYPLTQAAGIEVMELSAETPDDLKAGLEAHRTKDGKGVDYDAVLLLPSAITTVPTNLALISAEARQYHIPIGGGFATPDGAGSLFDYSGNELAMGKQAAIIADKVLRGTPASSIPVESAHAFVTINLKEASIIGVTIPKEIIGTADKVIR